VFVDGLERGSADVHDHLVFSGDRLRELLEAGRLVKSV